jgi:hypothetical protein
MIVSQIHVIVEFVLMETTRSRANVVQAIQEDCVKRKLTNAIQIRVNLVESAMT